MTRLHQLLAAPAASLALLATVLLAPEAPWRAPLTLVGGVWAPGHALLAVVYPLREGRLDGLERVALALVLGLVALPLVGLVASGVASFTAPAVAVALCVATLALSAGAALRRGVVAEPAPSAARRALDHRPLAAAAGAALLLAAGAWLVPTGEPAPPHLALLDADEGTAGVPRTLVHGEALILVVETGAGDAPAAGTLEAWAYPADPALDDRPLLRERVALAAGTVDRRTLVVHDLPPGDHFVVVTWDVPPFLQTHVWLDVVEALP